MNKEEEIKEIDKEIKVGNIVFFLVGISAMFICIMSAYNDPYVFALGILLLLTSLLIIVIDELLRIRKVLLLK